MVYISISQKRRYLLYTKVIYFFEKVKLKVARLLSIKLNLKNNVKMERKLIYLIIYSYAILLEQNIRKKDFLFFLNKIVNVEI